MCQSPGRTGQEARAKRRTARVRPSITPMETTRTYRAHLRFRSWAVGPVSVICLACARVSAPVGPGGDPLAGHRQQRAVRAVQINDLEPPMLVRIGAVDRHRDPLAVGRPARRGIPFPGREDAPALLSVEIDDPDA